MNSKLDLNVVVAAINVKETVLRQVRSGEDAIKMIICLCCTHEWRGCFALHDSWLEKRIFSSWTLSYMASYHKNMNVSCLLALSCLV